MHHMIAIEMCQCTLFVIHLSSPCYFSLTGQIQFIDIEFAMYNYEHFEIAHHFCQYQGKQKLSAHKANMVDSLKLESEYSKTCVKRPLKIDKIKIFNGKW